MLAFLLALPLQAMPPPVVNLGIAIGLQCIASGPVAVVSVSEASQAGTDLNGDGDALDLVAHSVHLASGTITNLQLAAEPIHGNARHIVLRCSESDQARDLNLDGDLVDQLLATYELGTGRLTVIPFAVSPWAGASLALSRHELSFLAVEAEHGAQDLNGDGDTQDEVLLTHDFPSGTTSNSGLAGSDIVSSGESTAVLVPEWAHGSDLDGDGSLHDLVLFVGRAQQGGLANTGLACLSFAAHTGRGRILLKAYEGEFKGLGLDVNGDGDRLDHVPLVYDLRSGRTTAVPLAMHSASGLDLIGDTIALAVWESAQGSNDLNGDGDTLDRIAHVMDLGSGLIRSLVFTSEPLWSWDRYFWMWGIESGENRDLNGDGDIQDVVPLVYDTASHLLMNVGVCTGPYSIAATDSGIGFGASEIGEGADLNGDGDVLDFVAAYFDFATLTSTNLGRAFAGHSTFAYGIGLPRGFAFQVPEIEDGAKDWNGDGDVNDRVLFVHDPVEGTLAVSALASSFFPLPMVVLQGRYLLEGVSEQGHFAQDLNGDGDTLDAVLHVVGPLY